MRAMLPTVDVDGSGMRVSGATMVAPHVAGSGACCPSGTASTTGVVATSSPTTTPSPAAATCSARSVESGTQIAGAPTASSPPPEGSWRRCATTAEGSAATVNVAQASVAPARTCSRVSRMAAVVATRTGDGSVHAVAVAALSSPPASTHPCQTETPRRAATSAVTTTMSTGRLRLRSLPAPCRPTRRLSRRTRRGWLAPG